MTDIYTPTAGNTPAAQALTGLTNTLNSLPSGVVNPQTASSAAQSLTPTLSNMQGNEQSNIQSAQNTLTQQAVSPLMQQYSSYLPAFEMYLHDQNIAGKYMGNTNPNMYSNPQAMAQGAQNPSNVLGIQDPYLANAATIASSVTPSPVVGGGFAGFSSPGSAINASQVPIQGVSTMLNTLNDVINSQSGRVSNAVGGYQKNYEGLTGQIGSLINSLNTQGSAGVALTTPGTKQNAAATYQTAKQDYINTLQGTGNKPTWDGLWWYMEANKRAWEGQGVDIGEMYHLQGQDRQQFGGQGLLSSGGKAPTAAELKAQTANNDALDSIRGFGNIMDNYWNGSMHVGTPVGNLSLINPLSQQAGQIESSRKVYQTALIKQFGAGRGKYIYDEFTQSFPGAVSPTGNAQGKLQGHLESLLTKTGMVIARNDTKNEIKIKDRSQLAPGDVVVKPTSESIPQLLELINEL